MALSDRIIERGRSALRAVGMTEFVHSDRREFPSRSAEFEGDFARTYSKHQGRLAIKWDHYFRIYDRHLSHLRNKPVRFLEIGVSHGGSLQIWRDFFGQRGIIFGIDIDERCAVFDEPPLINVRIGSQADAEFLRSVVNEMGGIDVVLDDGSHRASHQRASFDYLFPILSPDGIYLVEDLNTNYWRGHYEGGWRRRTTFIEHTKNLIDDLHGWWHNHPQTVIDAHRSVEGIHFYDSLVVIEKRRKLSPYIPPVGKPAL